MSTRKFLTTICAASALALMTTGAYAATLTLQGTASGTHTLQAPGTWPDGYNLLTPAIGTPLSYFSDTAKNSDNGLYLNGPAKVTYTYVGSEAGYSNYSLYIDGTLFQSYAPATAVGDTASIIAGTGMLDFSFGTVSPAGTIANNGGATGTGPMSIGYAQVGDSWYAFFDDSGAHTDFDDLVFRIDVAAIPVPAGGLLLLGALGGLGMISRRKKKAA